MDTVTELIHDCETGQIIVREMTPEEIAELEKAQSGPQPLPPEQ